MAKKKTLAHFTGAGIASYVHLNEPDTKFKSDGEYSVQLVVEEEEADRIRELVMAAVDAEFERLQKGDEIKPAKKKKMKKETKAVVEQEDEEGDPTGKFVLKFKTNATYVDRETKETKQKTIEMRDSVGRRTKQVIWGGSTLRVRFTVSAFYSSSSDTVWGSLRLSGVQIVDLVGPSADGGDGGFGAVEDGFVASNAAEDHDDDGPSGNNPEDEHLEGEDPYSGDGF